MKEKSLHRVVEWMKMRARPKDSYARWRLKHGGTRARRRRRTLSALPRAQLRAGRVGGRHNCGGVLVMAVVQLAGGSRDDWAWRFSRSGRPEDRSRGGDWSRGEGVMSGSGRGVLGGGKAPWRRHRRTAGMGEALQPDLEIRLGSLRASTGKSRLGTPETTLQQATESGERGSAATAVAERTRRSDTGRRSGSSSATSSMGQKNDGDNEDGADLDCNGRVWLWFSFSFFGFGLCRYWTLKQDSMNATDTDTRVRTRLNL
ncbi:pollen-specific leucine-rich repeat extensin-like protein 3 [Iris pallida]|uniref:Pollen-specific leucine-rich repeat extensin-like protein 3 n=1 Tax=Iris pallida TaxID=29817 RepID=A0AAX6G9Y3_IRIPA|nr:pollen-specific leucine-rich repeat extensin-like protein 3 [Iris pallida]